MARRIGAVKRGWRLVGKLVAKLRRRRTRKQLSRLLLAATLVLLVLGAVVYQMMPKRINPAAYASLLQVIADGESNGNYNAYFGHANNQTVCFTKMTIQQVLDWQQAYVAAGNSSSAVGKYQIIRPTLARLVQTQQLDLNAQFDAALQDQLAIALIDQRGAERYVDEQISREQFAANLAQEWASLPRVVGPDPNQSYYAGDGLNAARITIPAVYSALDSLKASS